MNEKVQSVDERLYNIACSFPVLKKAARQGNIPGITPTGFYDEKLAAYLYKGAGRNLSRGAFLALEFLLNMLNPYEYKRFNFGMALNVWDSDHMGVFIKATTSIFNGC